MGDLILRGLLKLGYNAKINKIFLQNTKFFKIFKMCCVYVSGE